MNVTGWFPKDLDVVQSLLVISTSRVYQINASSLSSLFLLMKESSESPPFDGKRDVYCL